MEYKIKDWHTRKVIGTTKNINKWCNENGYMPHHRVGKTWIVIK
jgi:hypothetical protein